MGQKLRSSTGKCACSNCYMPVEPSSDFCDSCGNVFKGVLEAEDCPSCETLISVEASVCPICNVRLKASVEERKQNIPLTQQEKDENAFLAKLLSWKETTEEPVPEKPEDIEEREQALKVLKSIATVETDEIEEKRIKEIEGTIEQTEDFEKLRKQMLKLGKPFESILERNLMNLTLIEKELEEKKDELKGLESKKGENIKNTRSLLEEEIGDLQKKRQAIKSYESNILILGGAFRKLLGQQQTELFRWEKDLKKRVSAFQKEVEMRRKQREKLKKREDALDKREEELSHRFLDLKSRENEIIVKEEKLIKRIEELKIKEEELKAWETEIEVSKGAEAQMALGKEGDNNFNKDVWLKEQKKLQADLFKMRNQEMESGDSQSATNMWDGNAQLMEDDLKEREKEFENLKNELEKLNTVIIEKDREIEKLKGGEHEFTLDEETKKLLKILDDLLEKLPEEVVDKFAKSDDYLLYEKVLEKFKL